MRRILGPGQRCVKCGSLVEAGQQCLGCAQDQAEARRGQQQRDAAYATFARIAGKLRPFAGAPRRCAHCLVLVTRGWACDELTLCQACWEDYGK